MNTLQLSTATWDLTLDGSGNIAVATGGSAIAQDVASAISTFLGEMYYDTTQGVPWLSAVFAQTFAPSLIKALLVQAALTVPGVVSAQVSSLSFSGSKVTGVVQVIDTTGQALGIAF